MVGFLSSTNELGIDWVVFRIRNDSNRPVLGRFDVLMNKDDGWIPIADKKHRGVSSRFDLSPAETTDVDVRWHKDMHRWRLHIVSNLQPTRFESWRFRLANSLRNYSRILASILEPRIHKCVTDGPEMRMKDPVKPDSR